MNWGSKIMPLRGAPSVESANVKAPASPKSGGRTVGFAEEDAPEESSTVDRSPSPAMELPQPQQEQQGQQPPEQLFTRLHPKPPPDAQLSAQTTLNDDVEPPGIVPPAVPAVPTALHLPPIAGPPSVSQEAPAVTVTVQSLFAAVKSGDVAALTDQLGSAAAIDIDLGTQDTTAESLGCTMLHYAAINGRNRLYELPVYANDVAHQITELLLSRGAPVNAIDKWGFTPLHLAAAKGCDQVVADLLSYGAFLDVQDTQIRYTPLHAAVAADNVGAILLMLEAGALVDEEVAIRINQTLAQDPLSTEAGLTETGYDRIGTLSTSGVLHASATGLRIKTSAAISARATLEDLQVQRSALSALQKGRTECVLPNGGGRLWALKDVTGMGIWDVLVSPSTACSVLDVLLQDLSHIDLIGARSLVQLLQQTQSLQYVIGVAHKSIAAEAVAVNLPVGEVASQLDAVKQYVTRAQHTVHQQSLRQPQRGRLPLPAIRPAMFGRGPNSPHKARIGALHGAGGGDGVVSGIKRFKQGLKAGHMARPQTPSNPPAHSVVFSNSSVTDVTGKPMASPFKAVTPLPPSDEPNIKTVQDKTGPSPRSSDTARKSSARQGNLTTITPQVHFTASRYVPGQLARAAAQATEHFEPVAAAGPSATGVEGSESHSMGSTLAETSITHHTDTHHLPPIKHTSTAPPRLDVTAGAAGDIAASEVPTMVMAVSSHAAQGGSGPVAEAILWPPGYHDGESSGSASEDMNDEGDKYADNDAQWQLGVVHDGYEEQQQLQPGVRWAATLTPHPPGYMGESPQGAGSETCFVRPQQSFWQQHDGQQGGHDIEASFCSDPGRYSQPRLPHYGIGRGGPGRPLGEGIEDRTSMTRKLRGEERPSTARKGRMGEDRSSAGRLRAGDRISHTRQLKLQSDPTSASGAASDGGVLPPPPLAKLRGKGSGKLSRMLEGMMSHRPKKQPAGAGAPEGPKTSPPPGFKVWTLKLEDRLAECVRCIQWQMLKLEQYVEAVLLLARDCPNLHIMPSAYQARKNPAPLQRNRSKLGGGGPIMQRVESLHLEDDDEDELAGVEFAWEVVRQAINLGDKVISHLLVDRLVYSFPRALLRCPWSTVMVDMCQAIPHVFHHLLGCLKDVSEDVRTKFVTSFNLQDLEKHMQLNKMDSSHMGGHDGSRQKNNYDSQDSQDMYPPLSGGLLSRLLASCFRVEDRGSSGGVPSDRPPTLGKLSAAISSVSQGAGLLATMEKRAPSLVGRPPSARDLDRYSRSKEDAASFKYTLYRNLVEGLRSVDYTLMKCFVEYLDQGVLQEMAQMSVYKDFVSLLPSKLVTRNGGGPDIIQEEMGDTKPGRHGSIMMAGDGADDNDDRKAQGQPVVLNSTLGDSGMLTPGSVTPGASGALGRLNSGANGARRFGFGQRRLRGLGSLGKSTLGGHGPAVNETKAEVLTVDNLLRAALAARSAESVQAVVESLVGWVEMNARNRRLCFLDGLTTALVSEMATHFPTAAAALFNISPQASRDIKVSSWLLNKRMIVCQCSHTRYSFMWRQSDLDELMRRNWLLPQVEMLADNNMRFMYICRAAQQGCSVDDVLELMDLGLGGQNVADLVSSGAQLAEVKDAIEQGLRAEVVSSMLGQKLPWQLVEVLLTHRISRTTLQDRTLRMDLLQVETDTHHGNGAEPTNFSHAFVTRFLEKWSQAKWEKAFLDKVFHASDTLCTKLKTAYDYKLSMRTNYLNTRAATSSQETVLDWPRLMSITSAFLQPWFLISHWFTAAVALLLLTFVELGGRFSKRGLLLHLAAQEHTVDATAKVLPIINAATLGRKSLLAGLMYADVPSVWYGTPVARAVVAVQWDGFAQVLMALHLLEHVILMILYAIFLVLLHKSLTTQQALLFFDGSPRDDPTAAAAAASDALTWTGTDGNGNVVPSPLDSYALGAIPAERADIFNSAVGMACMVGLLMFSLTSLATRLLQLRRAGFRLWSSHLANHLDVLCSFFCLATVVDFLLGDKYTNMLSLGAVGTLVMFTRLTLFSTIVERMGSLVRTVTEIMKDLRYFFVLMGIIFGGFAMAFNVQQGGTGNYGHVLLHLFTTMTSDFSADMLANISGDEGAWLMPQLALALWITYGFMVGIVLLALLISIMNDTFDRIKDAEEVEVLRNKARIIVDLQMLLTPQAMETLQDASLGPFLHTLSAGQNSDSSPTLSRMDEWQGRMQQLRKAMSMELQHYLGHLNKKKNAPSVPGLPDEKDGTLAKDVSELHAVVKAMRAEIAQFARTVATGPPAGKDTQHGGTAPATPAKGGAAAPVAAPAAPDQSGPSVPQPHTVVPTAPLPIEDLQRSACSVLGKAAAFSADGHIANASDAVNAALEGGTLLQMSNLPGRYFNRELPCVRATPNEQRQTLWRIAAKLADQAPDLNRVLGAQASATGSTASGATSSRPLSFKHRQMLSGKGDSDGKAQSGMLARFAVQTLTSIGRNNRSRIQRVAQLQHEAGATSLASSPSPSESGSQA